MKKPKPEDQVTRSRARIIDRALGLRGEIEQVFTDCAAWNDNVRQGDEEPIDPDPDGRLRRMADSLDRMLEDEAHR
jgi:hypothetical protein